jgi:hypothetical protein
MVPRSEMDLMLIGEAFTVALLSGAASVPLPLCSAAFSMQSGLVVLPNIKGRKENMQPMIAFY